LRVISSQFGTIEVNESSFHQGGCSSCSFLTEFESYSSSFTEIIQLLNSTYNYGSDHSSGIFIGSHESLLMHFCLFRSNSRRNTIVLLKTTLLDQLSCLEFIGNEVSNSSVFNGLIFADGSCQFRHCLFISNTLGTIVGGNSFDTVSFIECQFDNDVFSNPFEVSVVTTSCIIANEESLFLNSDYCKILVAFPNLTSSSEFTFFSPVWRNPRQIFITHFFMLVLMGPRPFGFQAGH
jgi:hypothetical protein